MHLSLSNVSTVLIWCLLAVGLPDGCASPEPSDGPSPAPSSKPPAEPTGTSTSGSDESSTSRDCPPPENWSVDDKSRKEVVREKVSEQSDPSRYSIRPEPFGVDGWELFRVQEKLPDTVASTYAVRNDGIVLEDREQLREELGCVYRAMELFERDRVPTSDILDAAGHFAGGDGSIIGRRGDASEEIERLEEEYPDFSVHVPEVERQDDSIEIVYFIEGRAIPSGGSWLIRYEITVSQDYEVDVQTESSND